ncbi:iap-1 [Hyposidra talaca nucleopolyhedrovirus]|uniref:Iap-1 n=1 Tax=Hyposidra talaca nucleopolyhedrovirus TaxID=1070315 RepID=A0A2Z4HI12_9ABAC|nr:iap-1 [Hyposidra talaca nucleopolyhedrovirus]AWW14415.1 iap-1 [Hyposidra talaca nucleopolyhedrovirus]
MTSRYNLPEHFNLPVDEDSRVDTFDETWPHRYPLTPELLAKHGFYFMGIGDTIKCSECKLLLTNFKPGQFIDRFHEKFKCSFANVRTPEYCLQNDLPYGDEMAQKAVSKLVTIKSSATITTTPAAKQAERENRQNCNICLSNAVNACLVPCGHVLCLNCAHQLDNTICPFCRNVFTIQKLFVN